MNGSEELIARNTEAHAPKQKAISFNSGLCFRCLRFADQIPASKAANQTERHH
jgi:hypothetical protein